ncbi:MAG TPA: helix-hairpin-helix domain-containing protein, partial [Anaerolineae bacterium]|nr:helix-hairpin-helix domain-containing protein [Anaerolineae bacterium]
ASHLTGLSVDIISHSELVTREAEKTKAAGLLFDLKGLGEKTVYNLNNHGIHTIKDLLETDSNVLKQIPGIGPKTADKLILRAREYFEKHKRN